MLAVCRDSQYLNFIAKSKLLLGAGPTNGGPSACSPKLPLLFQLESNFLTLLCQQIFHKLSFRAVFTIDRA